MIYSHVLYSSLQTSDTKKKLTWMTPLLLLTHIQGEFSNKNRSFVIHDSCEGNKMRVAVQTDLK